MKNRKRRLIALVRDAWMAESLLSILKRERAGYRYEVVKIGVFVPTSDQSFSFANAGTVNAEAYEIYATTVTDWRNGPALSEFVNGIVFGLAAQRPAA
jgi:hypothetical protein